MGQFEYPSSEFFWVAVVVMELKGILQRKHKNLPKLINFSTVIILKEVEFGVRNQQIPRTVPLASN